MMDGYPYCIELSAQAQAALETSDNLISSGRILLMIAVFFALSVSIYLTYKTGTPEGKKDSSLFWWLLPFLMFGAGGTGLTLVLAFTGYLSFMTAIFVAVLILVYLTYRKSLDAKKNSIFAPKRQLLILGAFGVGGTIFTSNTVLGDLSPVYGIVVGVIISGVYCLWRFKGGKLETTLFAILLSLAAITLLVNHLAWVAYETVYDGGNVTLRESDIRYQPGACAQWKTGPDLQVVLPKA